MLAGHHVLRALLSIVLSFLQLNTSDPHAAAHAIGLQHGSCSGSAVGRHTVLFALHCVNEGGSLVAVDGHPVKTQSFVSDGGDALLVRVNVSFINAVMLCDRPAVRGERISWYGNPRGMRDIYRRGYVAGFNGDEVLLDAQANMGDSGSAVISSTGCVLGVISSVRAVPAFGFRMTVMYPMMFTQRQRRHVLD